MRKNLVDAIKKQLLQRKQEIAGYVADDSFKTKNESGGKDIGDEALEISLETLESSIRSADMDELKFIDEALKRIDNNSYGICVDCESEISQRRLEIFPFAARCIVCQERYEG